MSTRILCARFPHLALVAAWQRHPELAGEPVVVAPAAEASAAPVRVVAASDAARAAGVRPGQPLRQARQLCPGAVRLPHDVTAVERLHAAALEALCAQAPAVEMGDTEAWCDLSGRHAAHAGEAAWAAAVARGLVAALDADVCPAAAPAVGVASTRHVALVAARLAGARRVRRVRQGEEPGFLAPLPVGVLPADPAVLARLGQLGLDRVGQVAALSPADLQRQFGPAGLDLLRLARGQGAAELTPEQPPRTLAERVVLDGSVADLEALRRCAERASQALGERLAILGLVAGRVELVLEPDDAGAGSGVGAGAWSSWRIPPVPPGGPHDLWPAVLGLLGGIRPAAPVGALRLVAAGLRPPAGRQVDMWRRGDAARDAVAVTVARLRDRFGATTVLRPRLALDPGDLPERRFTWAAGAGSTVVGAMPVPAAGRPAASTALRCPPAGTRPVTVRGDRRPDWRDGDGPVSRVRRERPTAAGDTVAPMARLRAGRHVGGDAYRTPSLLEVAEAAESRRPGTGRDGRKPG